MSLRGTRSLLAGLLKLPDPPVELGVPQLTLGQPAFQPGELVEHLGNVVVDPHTYETALRTGGSIVSSSNETSSPIDTIATHKPQRDR